MKVRKPAYDIISFTPCALRLIERCGRVCYQSESKDDAGAFVRGLVKNGHHSVLEHASATVQFIVDRGVSHELVRHRLASYSQESQRYVNYKDRDIEFIRPSLLPDEDFEEWEEAMQYAEQSYKTLIEKGCSPQTARSVLPNSTATEVVMTCNFREWRHILQLRTSPAAHPDMREIMLQLVSGFVRNWSEVFIDLLTPSTTVE